MFNNLIQFAEHFRDETTCYRYFEQLRWNGKPACGHCHSERYYVLKDGRNYKCANTDCRKRFNVRTGSVFAASNIPLSKWFIALYLSTNRKKGISSLQLSRDIGVTQKTAWFILMRLRELFKEAQPELLDGVVECDETYIGGKQKNKHFNKKVRNVSGRNPSDKVTVWGVMQRGGKVRSVQVENAKANTLIPLVYANVESGSQVMTDEWLAYGGLKTHYHHAQVQHSTYEWANGDAHTNNIENYWSHLKRMYHGTYHSFSRKHTQRYLCESDFRYNTRSVNAPERFGVALSQASGRRLLFKELIKT